MPSPTSKDGTVTVATTPGASKKPRQRKRQRNERANKITKAAQIEHCGSYTDSDFV